MTWLTAHWSQCALIVSEVLGLAGLGGVAKMIKDFVTGVTAAKPSA